MGSLVADGTCVARRIVSPFVVAHRAGNCITELRVAEQLGVGLVEADLRLFRGRVEIRHLKSVGPLPFYWDRWQLASPFRRHLVLDDLLAATAPTTELLLDLKGRSPALAAHVRRALEPLASERRFSVCARAWSLLEAFDDLPVRRFASVGNTRQLQALLRRFEGRRLDGVSIHERLLDERVVRALHSVSDLVLTWPVNAHPRARQLVAMGVDGLITDRVPEIGPFVARAAA